MFIDFGQAILHNGVCFLRYDDTNPEAEKQEFVDAIARVCVFAMQKDLFLMRLSVCRFVCPAGCAVDGVHPVHGDLCLGSFPEAV